MQHDDCVGIFRAQEEADAMNARLQVLGLSPWKDRNRFGGPHDSRFRVFVRSKSIHVARTAWGEIPVGALDRCFQRIWQGRHNESPRYFREVELNAANRACRSAGRTVVELRNWAIVRSRTKGDNELKNLLVLVMMLLSYATAAVGQTRNATDAALEARIIALDRQGWEAWEKNDSAWFKENATDDFMSISSDGISN